MHAISRVRRPSIPVRLAALTAATTGALAGTAAYFLDRDAGARRRHRVADAAIGLAHRVVDAADVTARDAANRGAGLAARARSAIRSEAVDDAVLEARVRTALGRAARHAGAVTVTASDGLVSLSGQALRDEATRILAATWNLRGVLAVEDRLDVRDEPGNIPALQGGGPQPEPRPDVLQTTWAPTTRLVAIVGGTGAMVLGVVRGGLLGVIAAIAGALFTLRGVTNLGVGRSLGLSGGRRGIDVRKTVELDVPVEAAYDLWSRIDHFPEFMTHVREVTTLGADRSHWVVEGPAGIPVEFDAVETRRVENEVIAWKSADGEPIRHSGLVRFERRPDSRSRVDVRLIYNPPAGVVGHVVASLFGVDPGKALDDDMVRFQSLLAHGTTTARRQDPTIAGVTGGTVRIPPMDRRSEAREGRAEPPADDNRTPHLDHEAPTTQRTGYPPVDTFINTTRQSD